MAFEVGAVKKTEEKGVERIAGVKFETAPTIKNMYYTNIQFSV